MNTLLDFCTTDYQRKIIERYEQGEAGLAISKALNLDAGTVRRTIRNVKKRAAQDGHAPGHWDSGTAAGYKMGKVTIQRGADGDVRQTWERQLPEIEDIKATLNECVETFRELIPRQKKTAPPNQVDQDLMNNIVIGDPHLDMLAYDEETGSNWDSTIAEDQHSRGVISLLGRAVKAHTGMLSILGDSLHRDSLKALTPGSGNLVDVDGRTGRSLKTAIRLFRAMVNEMLKTHHVVVINFLRGNHSETLEMCLRMMLEIAYENEPRVNVLDNTSKHIPYVFGDNFLLSTHGDRLNDQKKADIAVGKYREYHGASKFTHILTGHVHHASQKEVSGCMVETFQALPTPDAWHTEAGYVTSDQSISLLTYHKKGGIVSRLTEYPRIYMGEK